MSSLNHFLTQTAPWLAGQGEHRGMVISSRIRLARNLGNQPFKRTLDQSQQTKLSTELLPIVSETCNWDRSLGVFVNDISETEQRFLLERHLVSRELIADDNPAAALLRADGQAAILVNEEDHLRIQTMRSGLRLTEAFADAQAIDQELEGHVQYAFDDHFGYLTSCPTNTGTGMRASVMLHLPGLVECKQLNKVLRGLAKLHMTSRGIGGEGTDATGSFYQVSNHRTMGVSEAQTIEQLGRAIALIREYETLAREQLMEHQAVRVEDRIYRAWGLLSNARRISSDELVDQLSWLRLGADLKLVEMHDWLPLDRLLVDGQPAHLELNHPDALLDSRRDELRATMTRRVLTQTARLA